MAYCAHTSIGSGQLLADRGCVIGGCIVANQDFKLTEGLPEDATNGLTQQRRPVKCADSNGDPRSAGCGRHFVRLLERVVAKPALPPLKVAPQKGSLNEGERFANVVRTPLLHGA